MAKSDDKPTPGQIGRVDVKSESGTTGVKFHAADAINTADALHDLMHDLLDKSSVAMGEAGYQKIKERAEAKNEMRAIRKRVSVDEDKPFIDGMKAAVNLMAAFYINKLQTIANATLAATEAPNLHNAHVLHAGFVGSCESAADFLGALHPLGRATRMSPSWLKVGRDLMNAAAHINLLPLAERYEAEMKAANGGSTKPN